MFVHLFYYLCKCHRYTKLNFLTSWNKSIKSKYPVLHVITDFNRYQLSFIYFDDNDKTYYLCESILNKSLKVISKIIFCLDNYYVFRESNGFALENGIKISIDGLIKAKTNIINIAKTKAKQIEDQS